MAQRLGIHTQCNQTIEGFLERHVICGRFFDIIQDNNLEIHQPPALFHASKPSTRIVCQILIIHVYSEKWCRDRDSNPDLKLSVPHRIEWDSTGFNATIAPGRLPVYTLGIQLIIQLVLSRHGVPARAMVELSSPTKSFPLYSFQLSGTLNSTSLWLYSNIK